MGSALPEYHPFRSAEARDRYLEAYDVRARRWPVASDVVTVTSHHGTTLVRVSGPDDGPPLVMLPGIWSDSLSWPPAVIEGLAQDFRVFTVDNIYDFGRSVNAQTTTSIADYVDWLDAVFDALDLDQGVNVLGCSLGAWLFAEYALHAPERIGKMVWLSPGGVILSRTNLGTLPAAPLMAACLAAPSTATVGALMRMLMHDAAHSDGPARKVLEEYIDDVTLGLTSFSKRPLAKRTNRTFSDAELRSMRMPVLYVAGERERFCPPRATVARLNSVVPAFETTVFPGAGHDLLMMYPEALTQRVLQFLTEQ